jgi:hypothetical protein
MSAPALAGSTAVPPDALASSLCHWRVVRLALRWSAETVLVRLRAAASLADRLDPRPPITEFDPLAALPESGLGGQLTDEEARPKGPARLRWPPGHAPMQTGMVLGAAAPTESPAPRSTPPTARSRSDALRAQGIRSPVADDATTGSGRRGLHSPSSPPVGVDGCGPAASTAAGCAATAPGVAAANPPPATAVVPGVSISVLAGGAPPQAVPEVSDVGMPDGRVDTPPGCLVADGSRPGPNRRGGPHPHIPITGDPTAAAVQTRFAMTRIHDLAGELLQTPEAGALARPRGGGRQPSGVGDKPGSEGPSMAAVGRDILRQRTLERRSAATTGAAPLDPSGQPGPVSTAALSRERDSSAGPAHALLDSDTVARLVNEALIEQARLSGIDLS